MNDLILNNPALKIYINTTLIMNCYINKKDAQCNGIFDCKCNNQLIISNIDSFVRQFVEDQCEDQVWRQWYHISKTRQNQYWEKSIYLYNWYHTTCPFRWLWLILNYSHCPNITTIEFDNMRSVLLNLIDLTNVLLLW